MLENMNLRMCHDEVQVLLDSDLPDEYKGTLIEALMEQKIDDPFDLINPDWTLHLFQVPSYLWSKTCQSVKQVRYLKVGLQMKIQLWFNFVCHFWCSLFYMKDHLIKRIKILTNLRKCNKTCIWCNAEIRWMA